MAVWPDAPAPGPQQRFRKTTMSITRSKPTALVAALLVAAASHIPTAAAQSSSVSVPAGLTPAKIAEMIPNMVGIGAGAVPDYVGSDDYTFAAAPAALLPVRRHQAQRQLVGHLRQRQPDRLEDVERRPHAAVPSGTQGRRRRGRQPDERNRQFVGGGCLRRLPVHQRPGHSVDRARQRRRAVEPQRRVRRRLLVGFRTASSRCARTCS